MSSASVVAFGTVFVGTSLALSVLLSIALLLGRRHLRAMGSWVERRAASRHAAPAAAPFARRRRGARRELRPLHPGRNRPLPGALSSPAPLPPARRAWASQPWALCLVVGAGTFVALRLRSLSLVGQHWVAQRALGSSRLTRVLWLSAAAARRGLLSRARRPNRSPSQRVCSHRPWWYRAPPGTRSTRSSATRCWPTSSPTSTHGDLWRRAALGFAASFGAPFLVSHALRLWELSAERICDRRAALAVDRPSTVASAMLALVRTRRTAPGARGRHLRRREPRSRAHRVGPARGAGRRAPRAGTSFSLPFALGVLRRRVRRLRRVAPPHPRNHPRVS